MSRTRGAFFLEIWWNSWELSLLLSQRRSMQSENDTNEANGVSWLRYKRSHLHHCALWGQACGKKTQQLDQSQTCYIGVGIVSEVTSRLSFAHVQKSQEQGRGHV